MNPLDFLLAAAGVGLLFAVLDGVHGWRSGADAPRARWTTFAFLTAVVVVYLVIQIVGFRLVPTLSAIDAGVRGAVESLVGRSLTPQPVHWTFIALVVVLTFYVQGLFDHLLHRFLSHSRPLWFTHEYHHLPTRVNVLMPGISARPFTVVANVPRTVLTVATTYSLVALLGLPLWDLTPLLVVLLVQAVVGTMSHSEFLCRFVWVHRVLRLLAITTPQEHVLHHAVDLEGNYGNFTTLWDRLLGTYLDPLAPEHQNPRLGLAYDQDWLGALTLGRLKLSPALRERFQVGRFCNLEPVTPPRSAAPNT